MARSMPRLGHALAWVIILTSVVTLIWSGAPAAGEQLPVETGAWRLVRTPNPRGGPEAVSIMHTADTSRSDLDLAGLMIRCNGNRSELAIVLLNAFPLRTRPRVVLGAPAHETRFDATVAPPGTAVVIPGDPKVIMGSAWHAETDLFVRVVEGPNNVSGVVPLTGLQSAFGLLMMNCPAP